MNYTTDIFQYLNHSNAIIWQSMVQKRRVIEAIRQLRRDHPELGVRDAMNVVTHYLNTVQKTEQCWRVGDTTISYSPTENGGYDVTITTKEVKTVNNFNELMDLAYSMGISHGSPKA